MSLLHGFGSSIGQVELDSTQCKSLKGDVYVLNSGYHLLVSLSSIGLKAPLLQRSSENKSMENVFNGSVSHITPDWLPVVGRGGKYKNLIYNFGYTNYIAENEEQRLSN